MMNKKSKKILHQKLSELSNKVFTLIPRVGYCQVKTDQEALAVYLDVCLEHKVIEPRCFDNATPIRAKALLFKFARRDAWSRWSNALSPEIRNKISKSRA